jgi:hypothetical protein
MPASGRLELTGGGGKIHGFLWSERYGAFRHVITDGPAAALSMVIVPAGLDPLRAAAAMEHQRGDVDPARAPALLRAPASVAVHLAGARVSNPGEAVSAAVDAYFARAGGMRALQRPGRGRGEPRLRRTRLRERR